VNITKDTVLDAVTALMRHDFEIEGKRNQRFDWPEGSVVADLYLPAPLHCIVQFDDAAHCTRERALTFSTYPDDTPLNFDVRRYRADQTAGDARLAAADVLADRLPPKQGLNPTVRIRADEVAELTGSLEQRLETLLSRRFAYHSGTVFQNMLANAGGKPHRTQGH
jgi:hypothetical protein